MKFRRPEEEDYSLSLTPLIDVVFLLLIFFMVSTAFIDFTRRMDIELPEVKTGRGTERERVYEIEMTLDKEIFLNGVQVDMEELAGLLKESDPAIKHRTAVIRADRRLDYGYVVRVMGVCRDADIPDISVAVQ